MTILIPSFLLVMLTGMVAAIFGAGLAGAVRASISHSGGIKALVVGMSMAGIIVTWRAAIVVAAIIIAANMQLAGGGSLVHAYLVTAATGLIFGAVLSLTVR